MAMGLRVVLVLSTLAAAVASGLGVERDVPFACGMTQVSEDLAAAIREDEEPFKQAFSWSGPAVSRTVGVAAGLPHGWHSTSHARVEPFRIRCVPLRTRSSGGSRTYRDEGIALAHSSGAGSDERRGRPRDAAFGSRALVISSGSGTGDRRHRAAEAMTRAAHVRVEPVATAREWPGDHGCMTSSEMTASMLDSTAATPGKQMRLLVERGLANRYEPGDEFVAALSWGKAAGRSA